MYYYTTYTAAAVAATAAVRGGCRCSTHTQVPVPLLATIISCVCVCFFFSLFFICLAVWQQSSFVELMMLTRTCYWDMRTYVLSTIHTNVRVVYQSPFSSVANVRTRRALVHVFGRIYLRGDIITPQPHRGEHRTQQSSAKEQPQQTQQHDLWWRASKRMRYISCGYLQRKPRTNATTKFGAREHRIY